AAGFGQMIIIVVFLPVFALTGVEAKMFAPMAAAFSFALVSAFIFSFTTIPAFAAQFLSGKVTDREPWIMRKIESIYQPIISLSLKFKAIVLSIGAVSILVGGILFSFLGSDFLPQLDEESIAIQFVRPTNISIDQAVAMQSLSEEIILEFPEVEKVLSRIGTAEVATDPMGVNVSDTYVILKEKEMWPEVLGKQRNKAQLINAVKERLEQLIPGQTMVFSQPIQLRFNELLEGVRADVALKVFGEDIEQITDIAKQAAQVVSRIPGAGDSEEEIKGKSPVLRIQPKSEELQKLGLPKENVLSTVETAIGGTEAGSFYEGIMRYPIIVRLSDEDRSSLVSVKNVPVGVGANFTVPVQDLAEINIQDTYSDIRREAMKKRSAVLINVRGRDMASFVKEAKSKVEEKVKLPSGIYLDWGGSFKNLQRAKSRLLIVVPLALLLVFIMIFMAFKSWLQTLMIFGCIPMALVGGVISLMLNGLNFSISAAIGFIALSGIAVLNGIVLVSYFNKLKLDGLTGDQLIYEGTKMRLRPVLMTASAAAFGFLPMMLSTGSGAEVQRPLASVVVGGIISATILTLIVLPVVYRLLEDKMKVVDSRMSH
ncbi:MAG: efflux RND transporter permease subunit, partial [Bdellovibrionales bacterium]|nr:efflux RND transporter permease subunit [Bdellovibrionales bacterium]